MSANEIPRAMYPPHKPPTIRYYGHCSFPWTGFNRESLKGSKGVNLGGPPLLTDVILHGFVPLDLAPIHPAPSVYNLGLFCKLPDELFYLEILEKLDLLSLIRFRSTSHHAHYVVDTLPEFQLLVKWAPQVIRGVIAVQTKIVATLATIVDKLRQRHCDCCGKAAVHIWLPTLERLCFRCAHRGPIPLEEEEILKQYGLMKTDLHLIPSFRFLPATFQGPPIKDSPPPIERELPKVYHETDKPPVFDPPLVRRRPQPHRNSFRVPQQHILYDSGVADVVALERTGQVMRPLHATEDEEVQRIADDRSKRQECIDLPPSLLPRRCRRAMGLVFAPWVNRDGAESSVFCQECLYITGKERNHAWELPGTWRSCGSCERLRKQDWDDRRHCFYSLMLPGGSDVHI